MNFEIDQKYSGFCLMKKEFVDEIKSLVLEFEHEQTGAQVLVMENDDDNKVFSITLRTPPSNDGGVAHILEHSVLCGSRKFPVKEPFLELLKGSLQTFLNAMTFPDKTMYPVASRNKKDFFNLMNVYLDAVYHPRITKEIFMQEGWHHELETPDQEIIYKGVVFNEMKGVFSSPENLMDRHLSHSLFPKSTYGFESGGDPQAIPDLTYEEFRDFHSKYYHPSNSRIFLYGDGDTREYLRFLHEEYLKEFERKETDSSITLQRKFRKPRRKVIKYPVSKNESLDKKTFVAIGFKLDKATNQEHCLAFNILSYLLLGTSASPLRKALIDSGLGSEIIGGGFDDNRAETIFAVGLKGTDPQHEEKVLELIFKTLKDLVTQGIEEDMVTAAVNTIDFKLREANFGGFPKGIVYNLQALASWLYDGDPLIHLKYDKLMKKIKRLSTKGYFEKLIERYFLNNNHQSIMVAVPHPELAKKQDAKVRKKLKKLKASLSPRDLETLVEKTRMLQEMQMSPDDPANLAKLPTLGREDIALESERFPIEVKRKNSPEILFHDFFTNNIAYLQIGFNTDSVPLEKIQYIPLLGRMVLGMGTRKHSYTEISKLLGIHTGGIRPWHFTSSHLEDRDNLLSYVFFNGKAVMEKLDKLLELYVELIAEYDFSDHKRLVEIVRSSKADMEDSIIPSGNQYVLSRLKSYQSKLGRFDELTDGLSYFRFLEDLLKRSEKDPGKVAEEFHQVADLLFTKQNTLVNVTCETKDYPAVEKRVQSLIDILSDKVQTPASLNLEPGAVNEGFLTASTVQYVGKGANIYDLGYRYSGRFDVLKSLLSTCYLWDRIRVKGGAYGSQNSFDTYTGDFGFVSYRDPNLVETLEVYDQIADYLAELEMTEDELTKLIIGSVGHLDPPLTPDRKGTVSMVEHLTGRTYEFKQKRREELLSTRIEDLKGFASLFEKVRDAGKICVLGNEEKIKKAKPRFDHLVKVFN